MFEKINSDNCIFLFDTSMETVEPRDDWRVKFKSY